MDWSIIFPSRERPSKLENLIESLVQNTWDPTRLEVLVAIDLDDQVTGNWLLANKASIPTWVRFYSTERQGNFSRGYYTWLYQQSQGRYVQALNDDVRFVTMGWDRIAIPLLDAAKAKYPDGAVYGRCGDGYGAMYACFPVLSREAVDAQGYFFHDGFTAWGADIHLFRIWSALARVVDLPFGVDHISYHTHPEEKPDEVHMRMKNLSRFRHETAGPETVRIAKALKGVKK